MIRAPAIRLASRTEVGARNANDDHHALGQGGNGHFAVLADGAGGHSNGQEASHTAVRCIERLLAEPDLAFTPENLTHMVRLAHQSLVERQTSSRAEKRMHATLVMLWLDAEARHALWSHVGDSRLYRVRQGRCEQLTQDDSIVQQMVLAGMLTPEQSRQHPQKNQLLAALGIEGDVEPHTVARPVSLRDGDAYLLCSDGWWEGFEPEDITAALNRSLGIDDWLADMAAQIAARATPRQDNYTAIAVWVGNPGEVTLMRSDDTLPRALRGG